MIDFIVCDDGFVAEFSSNDSIEDIMNFMSTMNGEDEESFSFINEDYFDEVGFDPYMGCYSDDC